MGTFITVKSPDSHLVLMPHPTVIKVSLNARDSSKVTGFKNWYQELSWKLSGGHINKWFIFLFIFSRTELSVDLIRKVSNDWVLFLHFSLVQYGFPLMIYGKDFLPVLWVLARWIIDKLYFSWIFPFFYFGKISFFLGWSWKFVVVVYIESSVYRIYRFSSLVSSTNSTFLFCSSTGLNNYS